MTDKSKILKKSQTRILSRETFHPNDDIMRQGDEGFRAYLIESGNAEVYVTEGPHELKVADLGPGDIIGEMALIVKGTRSATVRAKTTVIATVIAQEDLEKKISQISDPATKSIIRILVQRLRETTQRQIKEYTTLADFQDRITGVVGRVQMGIDKQKRDQFREDIEPLLDRFNEILDRYSQS